MNPLSNRLHDDLLLARYLEAVESEDFPTQEEIWKQAETQPSLCQALEKLHEDLLSEYGIKVTREVQELVRRGVENHLPSGQVESSSPSPVRIADVAEELFRQPPPRMPATAHAFNESLRQCQERLPDDLGLNALIRWAEFHLGQAPLEYWKAFREAALRLELRYAAQLEYQLAARSSRKPGGAT
jgi:hypothetical protein